MKEIPLTQGKVALVDDEDFEYLNQWKWCAIKSYNTYYAIRVEKHYENKRQISKTIIMHRLIMGFPKDLLIDHINHNGIDNRKENLRLVTNRENSRNRIDQSETIGIYRDGNRFYSRIRINGKSHYIGSFKSKESALLAYNKVYNSLVHKPYQP